MTFEGIPDDINDRIAQHEQALRDAGFDEEDIAAIRDFRENATDEDKRRFLETTVEIRRDFLDSGIDGLKAIGRSLERVIEGDDDRESRPPLFFDGDYVDHGLSAEEWDGLEESTQQTLRDPNI